MMSIGYFYQVPQYEVLYQDLLREGKVVESFGVVEEVLLKQLFRKSYLREFQSERLIYENLRYSSCLQSENLETFGELQFQTILCEDINDMSSCRQNSQDKKMDAGTSVKIFAWEDESMGKFGICSQPARGSVVSEVGECGSLFKCSSEFCGISSDSCPCNKLFLAKYPRHFQCYHKLESSKFVKGFRFSQHKDKLCLNPRNHQFVYSNPRWQSDYIMFDQDCDEFGEVPRDYFTYTNLSSAIAPFLQTNNLRLKPGIQNHNNNSKLHKIQEIQKRIHLHAIINLPKQQIPPCLNSDFQSLSNFINQFSQRARIIHLYYSCLTFVGLSIITLSLILFFTLLNNNYKVNIKNVFNPSHSRSINIQQRGLIFERYFFPLFFVLIIILEMIFVIRSYHKNGVIRDALQLAIQCYQYLGVQLALNYLIQFQNSFEQIFPITGLSVILISINSYLILCYFLYFHGASKTSYQGN